MPLAAQGRAFPQVPTLGARSWSGGGRRSLEGITPNRVFRARLLLEKAAFLVGGGAPTPPSPAWALSQAAGERGEGEGSGSRPSWALAGSGGRCGSPHVYPGDDITGGRDEGLRVPRVEAPQICYLREWDHIQMGRAPLHELPRSRALPGPRCPCMAAVSRVSLRSFSQIAAAVSLRKRKARQYPARWPYAQCRQRPWGTPLSVPTPTPSYCLPS